jgi:hypothetical protein
MELKSQIHGIDISHYSKPFKIVFTLADQLLNQGYIIRLDNHYSSPDLFNLLNQLHTIAVRTVRSNRKGLPEDVINCKLMKEEWQFHIETNSWCSSEKTREMYACSAVYMMMMMMIWKLCVTRNVE